MEGYYAASVDRDAVAGYLTGVADHLGLRTCGEPVIHAPGGAGRAGSQGFDAFLPLVDSGIALYVWSAQRFFSALLHTCRHFETEEAVLYTKDFFAAREVVFHSF